MSCFIIAEAGVNHNGSDELALQLIETAAKMGADAVKFQTFTADKLVTKDAATAEYQKLNTGSDDQYTMLKQLELSEESHIKLINHCRKHGVEFMSTPFDVQAAELLVSLGMKRIKVPSGELTNLPFIGKLASFNQKMIISTGMASLQEVKEAIAAVIDVRNKMGFTEPVNEMLVILHCTSNYPAKYEDVNLKAMQTMADEFGLHVGYSDHTDGTLVSVAAVAMGAKVVEKHFTLDRNMPGPDHQASLEPDDLGKMIMQIRQIEACMGDGIKEPRASELPVRELVRRSVTLTIDKKAGDFISLEDLDLLRPGTGIPPKQLDLVVGKLLKADKVAGTALSWQDFVDA